MLRLDVVGRRFIVASLPEFCCQQLSPSLRQALVSLAKSYMMPVCVPTAARTILCQLLKGKGDKDQSSREQCNGMFQIWLVMSGDGLVASLRPDSRVQNGEFMIETHSLDLHFHTRRLLRSQWLVEHSGPRMPHCGWYSDNVIGSLAASLQPFGHMIHMCWVHPSPMMPVKLWNLDMLSAATQTYLSHPRLDKGTGRPARKSCIRK